MDDFDRWLLEEYQRVTARLADDPAELAARLARRRQKSLTDPPRAWCLAVRASDTRITPLHAIVYPTWALTPDNPTGQHAPHHVTLDARLLKDLCQPVHIDAFTPNHDVARKLGVTVQALQYAIRKGVFQVKRYPLGGHRGKPVPLLVNWDAFDPSIGAARRPADPLWGGVWQWAAQSLPDDLRQALTRVPHHGPHRRFDHPAFWGWRWQCPACARPVRTVYYPLPRFTIPRYLGDLARDDADAIPAPPGCFACQKCHRVRYASRVSPDAWNHFITHVTAGLVFGHEIPRPENFAAPAHRQQTHRPRAPGPTNTAVLHRLRQGQTERQIAAALDLAPPTIHGHVRRLYKRYNVHRRADLIAKLSTTTIPPTPDPKATAPAAAAPRAAAS